MTTAELTPAELEVRRDELVDEIIANDGDVAAVPRLARELSDVLTRLSFYRAHHPLRGC